MIHSPGPEIERMTPATARELLYNEIIPIEAVNREYTVLERVLAKTTDVYEIRECAQKAMEDHVIRETVLSNLVTRSDDRVEGLEELSAEDLVAVMVEGRLKRPHSLEDYLSERTYDLAPLPNLYFTRDSAAVVGDAAVIGGMAHEVRKNEALLAWAALQQLSGRSPLPVVYNGAVDKDSQTRIEGGDILVAGRRVLLVGVSERTSARGVDRLVEGIVRRFGPPWEFVIVQLPISRATIHLDMVLTLIDRSAALVYSPLVDGVASCRAVAISVNHGRHGRVGKRFEEFETVAAALKERVGVDEFVPCGGDLAVTAEREQWLAGTNVFALAPGQVVAVDCNAATLEALHTHGFLMLSAAEFLAGPVPESRCVVTVPGTELARGGGGVRCMTMPLRRSDI